MRVPFGLRSYATDSESGSCSGSDISDFPPDSDGDSFSGDFRCEPNLPGFETFSPKTDSGKSNNSPSVHHVEPNRPKKSWSEIDEQARIQEQGKTVIKINESSPQGQSKGRKNTITHIRRDSALSNRSDRNEYWRQRKAPPREKKERRNSDRKWRGNDQPLKGAVVRPYTLPSGPITVLRRPGSISESKTEVDEETIKQPSTPDLNNLGFKHTSKKDGNGGKAKVVNTRYGEGYVVENPPLEKIDGSTMHSIPAVNTKVAKSAALMAMAGLRMSTSKESTPSRSSSNAESYDRTLGGQFNNPKSQRRSQKKKDRVVGGLYSDRMANGNRSRPNVYIGRRPKLETRHVRDDDFLVGE